MRIVVVQHIPEDPVLRRAWNELALRMERPEVFYTYEWAVAVQGAYGKLLKPFVVMAYEGDSLVGVAALAEKKKGEFSFLCADTGDYCEFLCDTSMRREFVEAVFRELRERKAVKVVLTNLPADSPSADAVSSASSISRYHLHDRPAYACAQVRLGSAKERVSLKQSLLAKKKFRWRLRELQKRGTVALLHQSQWSEIQPLLGPFIRAHVARFLETGKLSNMIHEERRVFLALLAQELSAAGWITLSRLLVGESTAAWNFGFRFAGSWFWYQPTVNDLYSDFSPGYCLLAKIVELGCDSPELDLVDLGLGAEGYKERFANASRQTVYCELNHSLITHWRAIVRYRASMTASASPVVESRIRAAVSFVGEVRRAIIEGGLGGMFKRVAHGIRRIFFRHDEVIFFEWPGGNAALDSSGAHLRPLDSEMLGAAALQYGNDPASLGFLLRSAQRLKSGAGEGFALVRADGTPLHFCWARDFEGFEVDELSRRLHAPYENAAMIFDCFTLEEARGHKFFSEAIALLAEQIRSQGKSAWIFSSEASLASLRGIENSGFRYKFTLGRKRIFFFNKTQDSVSLADHPADGSAAPAV